MKTISKIISLPLLTLGLVGALLGCTSQETTSTESDTTPLTRATVATVDASGWVIPASNNCEMVSSPCGGLCPPPEVSFELPQDFSLPNQACLDCFGWQVFIALNWLASPTSMGKPDERQTAANFGTPGDFSPVVWETYKDFQEVFRDEPPQPWGPGNQDILLDEPGPCGGMRCFELFSKSPNDIMEEAINSQMEEGLLTNPTLFEQAIGAHLTDQEGNLVWYDIRMNQDVFNFIFENQLFDPEEQASFGEVNKGIFVPQGPTQYGDEGTIEIKAAWRIIPEDQLEQLQPYYKITEACIPTIIDQSGPEPIFGGFQPQHLGLVGLHIIMRTPTSPQFVWMTFENIFNTIEKGEAPTPGAQYTFYDPESEATPNRSPNNQPLTDPVQVVREIPINEQACQTNIFAQDLIRSANPNSVFQYYELVDVQWPQSPVSDSQNNNGETPLALGGSTPQFLANATMETYFQKPSSCVGCHKGASISTVTGGNPKLATSYSFLFQMAQVQKE